MKILSVRNCQTNSQNSNQNKMTGNLNGYKKSVHFGESIDYAIVNRLVKAYQNSPNMTTTKAVCREIKGQTAEIQAAISKRLVNAHMSSIDPNYKPE